MVAAVTIPFVFQIVYQEPRSGYCRAIDIGYTWALSFSWHGTLCIKNKK